MIDYETSCVRSGRKKDQPAPPPVEEARTSIRIAGGVGAFFVMGRFTTRWIGKEGDGAPRVEKVEGREVQRAAPAAMAIANRNGVTRSEVATTTIALRNRIELGRVECSGGIVTLQLGHRKHNPVAYDASLT